MVVNNECEPLVEHASNRLGDVLQRAHLTLIGNAVGVVLAICNEILCARILGVNSYGLYALALILARVSERIAYLGLPVATMHFVSIYRDQNTPGRLQGTILASVLAPLACGSVLAAILYLAAPVLADRVFANSEAAPYVRAIAVAIPFMALSELTGIVTRALGHAGYYVVVRYLVPPLVFMALLISIALLHAEPLWTARAVGAAYASATLVGTVYVLKLGRSWLFRPHPAFNLPALYSYSLPVLWTDLLYLVIACTPILMLGALQSESDVGVFRASMQFVLPFDMIVLAFDAAAGPSYAVLSSRDRKAELAALVGSTTTWMSVLALGLLLVIVLNSRDLLRLMGPGFSAGATTLLVLASGYAVLTVTGSAGFLLAISGRQRYELFNAAAAALLSVALNLTLIRRFGSLGAAIATTASCVLISALRVVQVNRSTSIPVLRAPVVRALALAAATGTSIGAASAYLNIGEGTGAGNLVLRIAFVVAVFGVVCWFVAFRPEDRLGARILLRARVSTADSSRLP